MFLFHLNQHKLQMYRMSPRKKLHLGNSITFELMVTQRHLESILSAEHISTTVSVCILHVSRCSWTYIDTSVWPFVPKLCYFLSATFFGNRRILMEQVLLCGLSTASHTIMRPPKLGFNHECVRGWELFPLNESLCEALCEALCESLSESLSESLCESLC